MGASRRGASVLITALSVAVIGVAGCGKQVAGAPTVGAGPALSTTVAITAAAPSVTTGSDSTPGPAATGSVSPNGPTSSSITVPSAAVPSASTSRSGPDPASSAASSSAEPSWKLPDPPGGEKQNEFNDVIAKAGVSYGLEKTMDGTKSRAVVFRVSKIQVDKGCDAKAIPVNGHFVVLTLEVELRDETPKQADDDNLEFTGINWTSYDAEGTAETGTHSDSTLTCGGMKAMRPVNEFDVGKVNSGIVVLDVSTTKGTTVLTTAGLSDGWEYTYG